MMSGYQRKSRRDALPEKRTQALHRGTHMIARLIVALWLSTAVASAQHPEDAFAGQKAPEIKGGELWINSEPLKLEQLRGKVVLIEFWAFDCPYCAEAMPHIKE